MVAIIYGLNFNGFFAGAKVGVLNSFANVDSTTNANYNTAVITSLFALDTQTNRHAILSHLFAAGAINIGYGKQLSNNQFYLGGEVTGNIANRDLTMTSSARHATLIYGRIGAAFNRIQVTSDNSITNSVKAFTTTYNTTNLLNINSQKNVVGLRVGLGAEHFITKKISAIADYVFTWYGNGNGDVIGWLDKANVSLVFSSYQPIWDHCFKSGN